MLSHNAFRFFNVSLCLLLAAVSTSCHASGSNAPSQPAQERISYPVSLLGGSPGIPFPGVWRGQPEVIGSSEPETKIVHFGKPAVRLNWDFSQCTTQGMSFANLQVNRLLTGHVQSINAWIYAEPEDNGASFHMWIEDVDGECFLSGFKIDWTGWKQVVIPVADHPAWPSGDGNGIADLPLSLLFLESTGAAQ